MTPEKLIQNYVVCKLEDKLDTLFSFLKSHLKSKIIVFFSTCSQVRFVFECFRSMQPGIPLTALHGKIKQERRTIIFMDYVKRTHACLFCTDIASRGLDFPSVDWVVQVDAPEDTAMYIHRVGRTARYDADGKALLLVLPQEEKQVVSTLQQASVPIKKLIVNPNHRVSVSSHASALLVSQPEVRLLAKKAFISYLRSLQLLPSFDKAEFSKLDLDAFSVSLGLAVTPNLPKLEAGGESGREANRDRKNVNRSLDKLKRQIKEAKEAKRKAREEAKSAATKSSGRKSRATGSDESDNNEADDDTDDDDDDDGDVLVAKKSQTNWSESEVDSEPSFSDTMQQGSKSAAKKKKEAKLKIQADDVAKPMRLAGAKKVKFDEEGEAVSEFTLTSLQKLSADSTDESGPLVQKEKISKHASEVKARLDRSRHEDQLRDKERVRELHRKRRLSDKPVREENDGDAYGVQLAMGGDENDDDEDNGHSDDDDDDQVYDSDQQEYEDEEEEVEPPKMKKSKKQKTKRAKDMDDFEDTDYDDVQDLAEQERLALQLMNR